MPHGTLSHESVTPGRSPEVSSATFSARPSDLQPRCLMETDFAVVCPLVPSRLPRIRFLSIGPHLRYGFFQTPPRGDALASRLPFTSIRLGGGLAPPSCQTCSAHQFSPVACDGACAARGTAKPAVLGELDTPRRSKTVSRKPRPCAVVHQCHKSLCTKEKAVQLPRQTALNPVHSGRQDLNLRPPAPKAGALPG